MSPLFSIMPLFPLYRIPFTLNRKFLISIYHDIFVNFLDAIEEFGVSVIELQVSNVGLPTAPPFHQMTTKANNFDRKLAKIHRDAVIPFLFSVEVSNDNKDYAKNVFIIETDNFTITELE